MYWVSPVAHGFSAYQPTPDDLCLSSASSPSSELFFTYALVAIDGATVDERNRRIGMLYVCTVSRVGTAFNGSEA